MPNPIATSTPRGSSHIRPAIELSAQDSLIQVYVQKFFDLLKAFLTTILYPVKLLSATLYTRITGHTSDSPKPTLNSTENENPQSIPIIPGTDTSSATSVFGGWAIRLSIISSLFLSCLGVYKYFSPFTNPKAQPSEPPTLQSAKWAETSPAHPFNNTAPKTTHLEDYHFPKELKLTSKYPLKPFDEAHPIASELNKSLSLASHTTSAEFGTFVPSTFSEQSYVMPPVCPLNFSQNPYAVTTFEPLSQPQAQTSESQPVLPDLDSLLTYEKLIPTERLTEEARMLETGPAYWLNNTAPQTPLNSNELAPSLDLIRGVPTTASSLNNNLSAVLKTNMFALTTLCPGLIPNTTDPMLPTCPLNLSQNPYAVAPWQSPLENHGTDLNSYAPYLIVGLCTLPFVALGIYKLYKWSKNTALKAIEPTNNSSLQLNDQETQSSEEHVDPNEELLKILQPLKAPNTPPSELPKEIDPVSSSTPRKNDPNLSTPFIETQNTMPVSPPSKVKPTPLKASNLQVPTKFSQKLRIFRSHWTNPHNRSVSEGNISTGSFNFDDLNLTPSNSQNQSTKTPEKSFNFDDLKLTPSNSQNQSTNTPAKTPSSLSRSLSYGDLEGLFSNESTDSQDKSTQPYSIKTKTDFFSPAKKYFSKQTPKKFIKVVPTQITTPKFTITPRKISPKELFSNLKSTTPKSTLVLNIENCRAPAWKKFIQ